MNMKEVLNNYDHAVLQTLARVRGLRAKTAPKYPKLNVVKNEEASRKRFERLEQSGLLAKSSLPAGSQLFRLSRKGVQLTGAPNSFADAPTESVAYDMVAASSCGWRTDEFVFLTREEFVLICEQLYPEFKIARFPGRFLLRTIKRPTRNSEEPQSETHLHFWLAEFKPAEQLARRIEVVVEHLTKSSPFFQEAIHAGIFGITVAVPTEGVKATLDQKKFPIEITIVVLEELSTTFANGFKA